MAIIFTEGFDLYNASVGDAQLGLGSRWTRQGGSGILSFVTGRFGGKALQMNYSVNDYDQFYLPVGSNKTEFCIGHAFYASGANPSNPDFFLQLWDGVTEQCGLRLWQDGSVGLYRVNTASSGTQVARSDGGKIAFNVWNYVEFIGVMGDSTTCEVWVNNEKILDLTGVDIQSSGNSTWDTVCLGGIYNGGTHAYRWDDMYVSDTAVRIGERRIETLSPSADTVNADFTPLGAGANYVEVDETAADGDTSYVESSTLNHLDLYELTDLSSNPALIDCIQPIFWGEKTDAAAREIAAVIDSGGTQQDGAGIEMLSNWQHCSRVIESDPNTAGSWSQAAVNALKAGPKVVL